MYSSTIMVKYTCTKWYIQVYNFSTFLVVHVYSSIAISIPMVVLEYVPWYSSTYITCANGHPALLLVQLHAVPMNESHISRDPRVEISLQIACSFTLGMPKRQLQPQTQAASTEGGRRQAAVAAPSVCGCPRSCACRGRTHRRSWWC